jgi:hypothetical protein
MWPRRGEKGQEWPTSLITTALGVLSLLWMIVGFASIGQIMPQGHTLATGIFLQLGATLLIAAITIIELILSRRVEERRAVPQAEPVVATPAT